MLTAALVAPDTHRGGRSTPFACRLHDVLRVGPVGDSGGAPSGVPPLLVPARLAGAPLCVGDLSRKARRVVVAVASALELVKALV